MLFLNFHIDLPMKWDLCLEAGMILRKCRKTLVTAWYGKNWVNWLMTLKEKIVRRMKRWTCFITGCKLLWSPKRYLQHYSIWIKMLIFLPYFRTQREPDWAIKISGSFYVYVIIYDSLYTALVLYGDSNLFTIFIDVPI